MCVLLCNVAGSETLFFLSTLNSSTSCLPGSVAKLCPRIFVGSGQNASIVILSKFSAPIASYGSSSAQGAEHGFAGRILVNNTA